VPITVLFASASKNFETRSDAAEQKRADNKQKALERLEETRQKVKDMNINADLVRCSPTSSPLSQHVTRHRTSSTWKCSARSSSTKRSSTHKTTKLKQPTMPGSETSETHQE
jgi:hypothetical protein